MPDDNPVHDGLPGGLLGADIPGIDFTAYWSVTALERNRSWVRRIYRCEYQIIRQ
jgi:hypothetical protein